MIARIKTANGVVYDTVVFAVINDRHNSQFLCFDETLKALRWISYYRKISLMKSKLQLIVIEATQDGWITEGKTKGYDWILSDKRYLKMIQNHGPLPDQIMARCKALQDAVSLPEWREITDEKSVNDFLSATGLCHDGCILAIESEGDFTTVSMEIWGGTVHVRLENAKLSPNCIVGYGNIGEILDSSVFFENGRVYWTNEYCINSTDQFLEELCHFSGTRMFWKIELE